MITGISGLELLPPYDGSPDLSARLTTLFRNADAFRAAIAFWTFDSADLIDLAGPKSIQALQSSESFLCIDLQLPTNIDSLADLATRGVRIFLNARRLSKEDSIVSSSPGLLHTKLILVDKDDEFAEFWVGSHNWTKYALYGPNTEASLALQLYKRAPLYLHAVAVLEDIRLNYCQPFNPNKIGYYRMLQKRLEIDQHGQSIIELEGQNVSSLHNLVISIFGTEEKDFRAISRVDNEVYLSIYDSDSPRNRFLYRTEVVHSGRLTASNPYAGGINISGARRLAFTEKKTFPVLLDSQNVGDNIMKKALFFANIHIISIIGREYSLADPLTKKMSLWKEDDKDPMLYKMQKTVLSKKPRIIPKILATDEKVSEAGMADKTDMLLPEDRSLYEKRASKDYRLISKKIVTIRS